MFLVLPAAVLFATVFAIGGITRHSEITAAKASGISFYRVIAPIFFGAALATVIGLVIGELVPRFNAKRLVLLQEDKGRSGRGRERSNFVFAGEEGRVYKVSTLDAASGRANGLEVERRGNGADYPTTVMSSTTALYTPGSGWLLSRGDLHIVPDSTRDIAFSFDSVRDRHFRERPRDLLTSPKAPTEMNYRELGQYIKAQERSGSDVNQLRVERMLKLAIPATCLVILLFGAPLATSTQRGGAAYGVGVSLGTTVVFLMMIQLTKAIGEKGIIPPEVAAWIPSAIFAVVGTIMMIRVRT